MSLESIAQKQAKSKRIIRTLKKEVSDLEGKNEDLFEQNYEFRDIISEHGLERESWRQSVSGFQQEIADLKLRLSEKEKENGILKRNANTGEQ